MAADHPERTTDNTSPMPGVLIGGRYKLLEEIGEGGMGTVWVAEQTEPVRRKVAVKLVKAGMDSTQVLRRFEAERQALALMDHPNIARVLDGATDKGRPFFVMEYVKGVPITRYCDDARLTVAERLELFIPVCQAVQHAHQKGVIHRDLKPSNILVCLYDGKPVPKVIDFGLAKALHQPLTEHTLHTAHGTMVGTPLYMSPEQAELNNLDVDTRTDVYSLGVLLYELLTGTTPLEKRQVKEAAWQEVLRLIKEEEPARPSARLSGSGTLPAVAAQRRVEPVKLSRLMRGELDWIVMKALEKERSRRYETANGFARDVQRYLADEPVEACPPSAAYRLKKVLRRYWKPLATAAAFVVVLLAAAAVTTWQGLRLAQVERQRAEEVAEQGREQAKRSQDVHDALTRATALREQARAKGDASKWGEAREMARRAEARAEGGEIEPGLAEQVRELLRAVDEEEKDRRMVATLEEIRLRQAEVKEGRFDVDGADARYAEAFRSYGVDVEALPVAEAVGRLRRSAIREELLAALDNWTQAKRETGAGREVLRVVADQADDSPYRRALRQAFARRDLARLKELVADPESLRRQAPSTLFWLAWTLGIGGLHEEAVTLLRRAQLRHPADFWINHQLALNLATMKPSRTEEAIGYYRAALALRPLSLAVHSNLGMALAAQNDFAGAKACYLKALEIAPKHAAAHYNLGSTLYALGDPAGATASFRRAIEIDPNYAAAYNGLGLAQVEQKDPAGATASFRRAIDLAPKHAAPHYNLGNALRVQKNLAEATASFRRAIKIDPEFAAAHCNLGHALRVEGDLGAALAAYRTGHALGSKLKGWRYPSAWWVKECERLIELEARLPAILKGESKLVDAADRLALADFCSRAKKLYAASLRLYAEAFAADPKLAESGLTERGKLQARYNAACSAALAAAGQGKDAAKPDAAERARLRRQALDWLRADLAVYAKLREAGKPADAKLVADRLRHWQADADLASVRGAALDKLPDDERQGWRKLWADVADLLEKASAVAPPAKAK